MTDEEKYQRALALQGWTRQWEKFGELKLRHLGPADERCPDCGGEVETLLDVNGKNPRRCCWRCEHEAFEREASR